MAGDGAVGGERQSPFLQRHLRASWRIVRRALRKEAVQHHGFDLRAADPRHLRAGDQAGAAPGEGNRKLLVVQTFAGERDFLKVPAGGDEVLPLNPRKLAGLAGQPGFDPAGERQIDVVAAEQDVIADRRPPDRRLAAITGAHFEQAEIRRSAADIDDEDGKGRGVRFRHLAPQVGGEIACFQPAIEGGLRFLKQAHGFRKAGVPRRRQRQSLRHCVERGRNRNDDLLRVEREIRARRGEAVVPGVAQRVQDQRRGADRRNLLRFVDVLRSPRQKPRGAIGGMMAKPRLDGVGNPARHFRGLTTR